MFLFPHTFLFMLQTFCFIVIYKFLICFLSFFLTELGYLIVYKEFLPSHTSLHLKLVLWSLSKVKSIFYFCHICKKEDARIPSLGSHTKCLPPPYKVPTKKIKVWFHQSSFWRTKGFSVLLQRVWVRDCLVEGKWCQSRYTGEPLPSMDDGFLTATKHWDSYSS